MGFIGIQRPPDPDRRDVASEPLQPDLTQKPVPPDPPPPHVPFWKRGQFKRYTGATISIIGGALALYPPTFALGTGLGMLGGLVFAGGVVDAKIKQKDGKYPQETITALLVDLVKLLVKIYKTWRESKCLKLKKN